MQYRIDVRIRFTGSVPFPRKLTLSLCASLLFCVCGLAPATLLAPDHRSENGVLINDLLNLSAPGENWIESENYSTHAKDNTPDGLYFSCSISAPIEMFMKCWGSRHNILIKNQEIVQRISANYQNYLNYLYSYLKQDLIAKTPDEIEQLREIYDQCQSDDCNLGKTKMHLLKEIHLWLMKRSGYFREELISKARSMSLKDIYIKNEQYLAILAKLDWKTALPIVEKALQSDNAYIRTYALAVKYTYYAEQKLQDADRFRPHLQTVINDKSAPKAVKTLALKNLLAYDWDGVDNYYLNLFNSDIYLWAPNVLFEYALKNPDFWIPKIGKLIKNKTRKIHNAAATVLSKFTLKNARRDALEPLIPWLRKPKWAYTGYADRLKITENVGRLKLVQSLKTTKIAKSIPGLIWIVKYDKDETYVEHAAQALVEYKAKKALPALRKRLHNLKSLATVANIAKAILALDGFSVEERVSAIIKYANQIATTEGRRELQMATSLFSTDNSTLDKWVVVGEVVAQSLADRKKIARAAKRIIKPAALDSLLEVLAKWGEPVIDLEIIDRLETARLNYKPVFLLLNNRKNLGKAQKARLKSTLQHGAEPGGIAAVLLGDKKQYSKILQSNDQAAQTGLLAGARLLREPLDIDLIAKLTNSTDAVLIKAIRKYLAMNNSPKARELSTRLEQGSILIAGRRGLNPGTFSFGEIDSLEEQLIEEMHTDKSLKEIYALLSSGYWGGRGQILVKVRETGIEAVQLQGGDHYISKMLPNHEYAALLKFLTTNNIDKLGPLTNHIQDSIQYEYLHLIGSYGRRVFMNNPQENTRIYNILVTRFWGLFEEPSTYAIANSAYSGDGVTVLPRNSKPAEWTTFHKKYAAVREACVKKTSSWQSRYDGKAIYSEPGRLVMCTRDGDQKTLLTGNYGKPVITADNWLVAAKTDTGWSAPNYVVRVNLTDMTETMINLEPADNFYPVTYLQELDKVLLVRYRDKKMAGDTPPTGPESKQYYLLDPASGETVATTGDLDMLWQHYNRKLQPVEDGSAWLAMADYENNVTNIGIYNFENLRFEYTTTINRLKFNSSQMWVDANHNEVYVDMGRKVVKLPLR